MPSTASSSRPADRESELAVRSAGTALDRIVDIVSELAVIGLATWTVLYHIGLIFDIRTNPLMVLWAVSLLVGVVLLARAPGVGPRRTEGAPGRPTPTSEPPRATVAVWARSNRAVIAAIGLGTASALMMCCGIDSLWWPGWVCAFGAAAIALGAALFGLRSTEPDPERPRRLSRPEAWAGSIVALAAATGLGIFSVFTRRNDPDDAFYVNKAQWVVEHGTIATRDTMFSDQTLPAIRGAGVPVSSIETLVGAVGRVFHLSGASVAWLVLPPIGTFLAVWAIWRLTREWAPRRVLLCFAAGLFYLLWAGKDGANLGVFFLARMQQGKVVFVAMLVPVMYLYLTRWLRRPDRRNLILLLAVGVAAVGLTSSSTFVVPLVCATVALPLLLQRRIRVALGALAPCVYPIITGAVVQLTTTSVNPNGVTRTAAETMHFVFGTGPFGAIGWAATFWAVWLVRDRAARAVLAGVMIVLVIVLAPGMLTLMNSLTGAHAVLWRTMWVAPIPVLVGLVAATPLPHPVRRWWTAPIPAIVIVISLVMVSVPLWAPRRSVTITSRPTLRYTPTNLHQARVIIEAHAGRGQVVAPEPVMRAITMLSVRVHAIDPLQSYVVLLDEPARDHSARILLIRLVVGKWKLPTPEALRDALDTLHITMVCLSPNWVQRGELVKRSGYTKVQTLYHEVCYTRPS